MNTATCPDCGKEITQVKGDTYFHHLTRGGTEFDCKDGRGLCCISEMKVREQEEDLPLKMGDDA